MGDPKRDLKGVGSLRRLIELYPDNLEYITECHRCTQKHLNLSDTLIDKSESQKSSKTMNGELKFVFESDIEIVNYFNKNQYDLKYISFKREQFDIHASNHTSLMFDTINYEISNMLLNKFNNKTEIVIARLAYYYTNKLIKEFQEGLDKRAAMNKVFNCIQLEKKEYAKIISHLKEDNAVERILVNSIESIEGCEGDKCLFILTTDLAEYILGKK